MLSHVVHVLETLHANQQPQMTPMSQGRDPTFCLSLALLLLLELGQQDAGSALQVRAGDVVAHVGDELLETGKVGGLPEIL